ncbi:hypothetical protein WNY59_12860 [Ahrensia kielensis]|uniref:Flagellar protein n=1 Tax=Ahrensia kielensis TaxID=76980 RepID=A0ABU9T8L4_9HYPH
MTSKRNSKSKKPWFDRGDVGLGVFLVTVTGGALFLPLDAYMNPARYSPPQMVFSRQQPGAEDHLAYMAGGRALFDLEEGRFMPANQLSNVDQITTGTVASEQAKAEVTPMPSAVADDVRLLAGDKRRAMIMSDDGIYIISRNSRLPGGARVRALIQKDGESRLVTNRYVVLRAE